MSAPTGVHPYADKFPMLPEPELAELAESIRANGLRQPIVVTPEGLILDGRNRAAACDRVGVEPEAVVYDGDDLAEYVIDCNVTRRNMTTGARAMATALVLAEAGRRENGRFAYGRVDFAESQNPSTYRSMVSRAGTVLDYKPDLAGVVVSGDLALDNAYQQADAIRRSAEADKVRERELRKREREEAKADAERNAQIVADLTEAEQAHYLEQIESGQMKPASAWAAYQEDTRKDREREREIDRGRRDTCTRIAECVRFLDGGEQYARIFVRDFYPHEHRFLAEGMRLAPQRIDSAIEFLTEIRKAVR